MKELENFYNNHYKTSEMMDWSELTERQKQALEKSGEYWKFQLDIATDNFTLACLKEIDKIKGIVNRFR